MTNSNSKGYDDPDTLRELYHGEGMTQQQVADELGCSRPTVIARMDEFGIETRDPGGTRTDAPYKDEDTLRRLYHEERLTTYGVADRLETDESTIQYWMDKHDIGRRRKGHPEPGEPAHYRTDSNGYEVWQVSIEGERHTVRVHRLAAVAWFGYNAVAGKETHHLCGDGWDNREANAVMLTKEEHARLHAMETEFWKCRDNVQEAV